MRRALKSLGLFFAFVVIYTLSRHVVAPNSTASTTTSLGAAPASSTTSTEVPGAKTCSAGDFSGVYNLGQGATGTVYASITLTKRTGPVCTLEGWPSLTLQDRTGAVLQSSTIDLPTTNSPIQFPDAAANHAPRLLSLSDGSVIRFDIAYSNVPSGSQSCPSVQNIGVQLSKGGGVVSVTPQYPPQPCDKGNVWVSPFFVNPAS